MSYFFSKTVNITFDQGRKTVEEKLKESGLGIVSEIDLDKKFKEKLDVSFRRYKILGACSPAHAYKAVRTEENIGLMLPCNVVIQEKDSNKIDVSVIDPVASMMAIENQELQPVALEIQSKLRKFIESL
ncbi:MAG: DUF302 domain-containing protein [Bacteroidales bacterium]|nr:DUF302 domain-containing protein [Bacteroidales bacterium]